MEVVFEAILFYYFVESGKVCGNLLHNSLIINSLGGINGYLRILTWI